MKYFPQFDSSDCAAACLAMITHHYGSRWSLAKIREMAGTDRLGTNLSGIVKASNLLGMDAKAVKGDRSKIPSDLPVPFIAHYHKDLSAYHFIVVERIGSRFLTILDPAEGRRKVSSVDFLRQWTGFAVVLAPTPEFKPLVDEKKSLRRYLPLLKPHIGIITKSIFASLVLTILGLVGSFYFSYLVDEVLPSRSESALHILSLGLVLLTFFQGTLGAVRSHMLNHFSLKTSLTLNFTYLKHVLSLPLSFFDTRKIGEILSRMSDGDRIRGLLSSAALSVAMDIMMMIIAGLFLFFKSPLLFGLSVVAVPLSAGIVWGFSRYFRENYRQAMAQGADSQSFLVETLNGINTVKGLNAAELVFHKIEQKTMKVTLTGYRGSVMGLVQGVLTGLVDGWAGNLLFWAGSYLILKDQMSLGELLTFNALLGYFLGPLARLLGLQTAIQQAMVAADRLGEILELPPEVNIHQSLLKPTVIRGCFNIQDLTYRYGAKRLVLDKVTLSIEPGSKVAFVGASGCGKSTLIKMLLKFYTPESGEVLLDGHNLLDLDTPWLRSRIGYVPQEVFLFSGSIRENLSLHKPEATFDEIVEAATRAQAHDFITALPERYDTVLAERGASLSGGERQRLALARALLGRPDILIFDEATSALDVITEKAVHDTISALAATGLTTILVAHRLATVAGCDRIFVMDKGKIIEQGSHQELVALGGAYTQLWEYQKL